MFATGIENSIPTINNGKTRVDQMEVVRPLRSTGARISTASRSSGSTILRYGPPIHKTFLGPGKYDWEFADITFAELKRRDITPIVDLCHFGVPDWIGNFQNPDFPQLFAHYAAAFAERYPVGAALHAGQRDVHLRDLLGQVRLVERAAEDATRASSPR